MLGQDPLTRTFPISVVMTGVSGRLLCPVSEFHQFVEFLLGHPVFTHEFPAYVETVREEILKYFPSLAEIDTSIVTNENWRECLTAWENQYGSLFQFPNGQRQRAMDPVESLVKLREQK